MTFLKQSLCKSEVDLETLQHSLQHSVISIILHHAILNLPRIYDPSYPPKATTSFRIDSSLQTQVILFIILMSHYTYLLPAEVYRWMVADEIIPNRGEMNDKQQVALPQELSAELQNGVTIARLIRIITKKAASPPPAHLEGIKNESTKGIRTTNWNFIWLCFDDLQMQFDPRIKELILQGESALIPEIINKLFDRDDNKDVRRMKELLVNQKPLLGKSEGKAKSIVKNNTLDIKRINTQKNPNQSESSLEFLILLLSASFSMSVEEILGLFTNQNKYLAHLIVKGVNDNFEGVVLFYSLLQKHIKKLKEFCDNDIRDAESCLYAIKPGFISKSERAAQLTIEIFKEMKNIYPWFISDTSRGSTTLMLGIKRHPQLSQAYWDLLLKITSNEQIDFFTSHFKKCFRDAEEMIEICTFIISPFSNSFLKEKLKQLGIIDEWMEIGVNLFEGGNLQQKLISFRFIGAVMGNLPEIIEQNEDYLLNLKKGWKERQLIEFIYLFDQVLSILEELAGQKNAMARKVFQIILEIMGNIYDNDEKREYLARSFITVLPKFPKIPTQYLIEVYKEGTLKTSDLELVNFALNLTNDVSCVIRIAETLLKLFNSHAVLNVFLGNIIYKLCVRVFDDQNGKIFAMKVIKDCSYQYSQLQGSKKIAQVAKHQPMYFVQKGNDKYNKEQEDQFVITEKQCKNIMKLIEKVTDLIIQSKNQVLEQALKQQLLETNAIIKKNHYKANNKALSLLLSKKFGVTREQQQQFNEQFRVKKSLVSLEESIARRKMTNSASVMPLASSRYGGPLHLKKEFDDVVQKRKKQEQQKRIQDEKRTREEAMKKLLVKKQLEKTNLLRGFAQEAELKEDGFWQKFKESKPQLELYPPQLMESRDIEYIDNLFKKYHKVLRTLFFKYTCSMYTIKSNYNFEDNKERTETLSVVELIQFLKDFKLFFLTNKDEVQNLVRDLNVKLIKKRQTQELDFNGFQQFIIQFCALIYTKTHTINANTNKGVEVIKKNFGHLSHLQLVQEWFNYLKLVFIEKGEKTSLFDEPQAAYFNETEVIKQFTKKLEQDPSFILPEGYKKVTEKVLKLAPKFSDKLQKFKESYLHVFEVLDEILYQSELRIHIIEPLVEKQSKIRVKPHAFLNIKAKLLQAGETKVRALSSIIDKKPAIPPVKMLDKKTLTFGMKLGLSYVSYKDKLLGEQVAYVIDDMLNAVESGKMTIEKQKIVNDYLKKRQEQYEKNKFSEIQKQKKRLERKNQLEKMKKQITDKKQKQLEQTKDERQRKKQKQLSRQKRLKEDKQKYLEEQKNKLKEKKKQEDQQQGKKKQQDKKKKEGKKKNEQQFKAFNNKQVQKFKKQFSDQVQKRKKEFVKQEEEKVKKEELVKKLRVKVHQTDKKAIETKMKMNEQIQELYSSPEIKTVFQQYQPCIRSLFDFLLKASYLSITQKKNNSEIIFQTWHYFNLIFQLNPLISNAKELTKIFRHFTKDKQVHKDYEIGLTYDEFQQALLRVVIKHKSIFNKLSQKIKDDMTSGEIDAVVQKDIEQKEKNEFEEPKQINVRSIMKEEDIKKDITDHYGDISKVNDKTLKGLIYYLKIPKDKQGQEKRFREILASKITYSVSKIEQLREKLNDEYSLPVPKPKKRKTELNESSMIKASSEAKQETK